MKIAFCESLEILSYLQVLLQKDNIFPQIKIKRGYSYYNIEKDFFTWKMIPEFRKIKALDDSKWIELFDKSFQGFINGKNIIEELNAFYCSNEWKKSGMTFLSLISEIIYPKLYEYCDYADKKELSTFLASKLGIELSNITLVYCGYSTYTKIACNNDGDIFFCIGQVSGYDEILEWDNETNNKIYFLFYVLSWLIFHKLTIITEDNFNYLRILFKPLLKFKQNFFIESDDDFVLYILSSAITYRLINSCCTIHTEKLIEILNMKGLVLTEYISSLISLNSFDVNKLCKMIKGGNVIGLYTDMLPDKKIYNAILKNSDLYEKSTAITIGSAFEKILKDNDCLMVGEHHYCEEHYLFFAKIIRQLALFGYLNIFLETSNTLEKVFNDFINGNCEKLPDKTLIVHGILLEKIREHNLYSDKKFVIHCFDMSEQEMMLELPKNSDRLKIREKIICQTVIKKLEKIQTKTIFFTGYLHVTSVPRNSFENIKANLRIAIHRKLSEFGKKEYALFFNSLCGNFFVIQRTPEKDYYENYVIDRAEKILDENNIVYPFIDNKNTECVFFDFSIVRENYKGKFLTTNFYNEFFDTPIDSLSSGGNIISSLNEGFDGMLLYPCIKTTQKGVRIMDRRKKIKNFHFFNYNSHLFLYNNQNQKLFFITKRIEEVIRGNIISPISLSEKEKKIIKEIESMEDVPKNYFSLQQENTIYVHINHTTKCNFACSYCFRNKDSTAVLSDSVINDIVNTIIKRYKNTHSTFVFVLGLTSEPLLDVSVLRNLKRNLDRYDNYLFKKSDFLSITAKELFFQLPIEIRRKYKNTKKTNYVSVLNKIIQKENLNNYYNFSVTDLYEGFSYLFDKKKKLNLYDLTLLNRKIIEKVNWGKIAERIPKYCSLSLTTNASCITENTINFLRQINLKNITVSCDGPKSVHDISRIYPNGRSTFNDTIRGINLLIDAGIGVNISCVLNPKYSNVLTITKFFKSIGVKSISFGLVRPLGKEPDTIKDMKRMLESFDMLYEIIFTEFQQKDYSTFLMVKNTLMFEPIRNLLTKEKFNIRCGWGRYIYIDNYGDLYPCLYLFGNENFCYGHYTNKETYKKLNQILTVDDLKLCKYCWARYLCSGACHYLAYFEKKDFKSLSDMECYYRKSIIEKALKFYIRICDSEIIREISRLY